MGTFTGVTVKVIVTGYETSNASVVIELQSENATESALLGAMATNDGTASNAQSNDSGFDSLQVFFKVS